MTERYLSIEGKTLPLGVKNIYWYWNKEHALDAKKVERKNNKSKTRRTKSSRRKWWGSLTAGEQADYRYIKLCEYGKYNKSSSSRLDDWNREYNKVIKENNYKSIY